MIHDFKHSLGIRLCPCVQVGHKEHSTSFPNGSTTPGHSTSLNPSQAQIQELAKESALDSLI